MFKERLSQLTLLLSVIGTLIYPDKPYAANTQEATSDLVIQSDAKIFNPNELSRDSLLEFAKRFTLNWDDAHTFTTNKKSIAQIETFLEAHPDYSHYSSEESKALGTMLRQLASYHLHIEHDADHAIAHLNLADQLLNTPEDKAANANELAAAYAFRFATHQESADKEKSLYYTNKIISEIYPHEMNAHVALAYYIQGLIQEEQEAIQEANASFVKALAAAKHLPDFTSHQYTRMQYHYATTLLEINENNEIALKMLLQVKKYWKAHASPLHLLDAVKNEIALGHAYLKMGALQKAKHTLMQSVQLAKQLSNAHRDLLVESYQYLADTYQALGDEKAVQIYLKKADAVDKS